MPVAATHSLIRARSSSSRRKRRRTGSRPAKSSTWEAVTRLSGRASRLHTAPSTGLVWRRDRSARRTRRSTGAVAVVVGVGAGAERGVDEGGEGLDVGAHDDDVAGFEGGVVEEEVEDGVAQHLHLAGPAVAGVDLDAAVAGVEARAPVGLVRERLARRRLVVAHAGLDAAQECVGVRGGDGPVAVGHRAVGQHELHLPGVAAPRRAGAGGGGDRRFGRRRGAGSGGRRRPPSPRGWGRGGAGTGARRGGRPAPAAPGGSWRAGGSGRTARRARGASASDGSASSRAHACSRRSAGPGVAMRARSRRHSSACQRASAGRGAPASSTSSPAAHAVSIHGRWTA